MSVFRDTLPHWTGPAYAGLIPLAAAWLRSRQMSMQLGMMPAQAKWALRFTLVLLIPAFVIVGWLPYNTGNKEWRQLGEGDPALDMNGFRKFGHQFNSLYRKDIKDKRVRPGAFILSDYWFPAAHLDYYVAAPAGLNFIAIGDVHAIHHYAWRNKDRPALQKGDDAYFITVSNYFKPPAAALVDQFETSLPPAVITQYRGGVAVRNFFVYRLRGFRELAARQ